MTRDVASPGRWLFWFWAFAVACSGIALAQFPPVPQEELQLHDNPAHPGDSAIILFREIQSDATKSTETHHVRIKIFNDAGKKYGDIEIPYLESAFKVEDIQARSVDLQGHSTAFSGSIFDKIVLRSKRLKITAKSFTLANVGPGSIVEYSYRLRWHKGVPDAFKNPAQYIFDGTYSYLAAEWPVQRDLFILREHFEFHPVGHSAEIGIRTLSLPKGAEPRQQRDGSISMDVINVPAYQKEEYSPPEKNMEARVMLFYLVRYYSDEGFWIDQARREGHELQKFLAPSSAIKQEAARLTAGVADPEEQLRKLYARVQKIRYLSYERQRSAKERKQEELNRNKNVDEVLSHGYAFANEINLLFVALAREAGFTAYPVKVAARDRAFFMPDIPDPDQFNAEVVEVQVGKKTLFLDPATLYCPFGLLPWEESATQGIRLDPTLPAVVATPQAGSQDALIERAGRFKLDAGGRLKGNIHVIFYRQEALSRKLKAVELDEAGRVKELEEEVKTWLPKDAMVKLLSSRGWDQTDAALEAEFDVEVLFFGMKAGQRQLFPASIFEPVWKNAFRSPKRENPVYFEHPYRITDDLELDMEDSYKAENLPGRRSISERFGAYLLATDSTGSILRVRRDLVMDGYYFQLKYYPDLQSFCDFVRTQDAEEIILRPVTRETTSATTN